MKLTNENVMIASLLGSQVVEQIPRFAQVENELAKRVLPPVKFLPLQNQQDNYKAAEDFSESEIWLSDKPLSESDQFFPFSFKKANEENYWLLPWEPLINIEAKNIITKRYIAKAGKNHIGSIKERWATDDYQITITGAFIGDKMRGIAAQTYPRQDMERLRDYLLTPEALEVKCELLQILGINRIVIESVNFPFTKGENVQAYEIKAMSDFPYQLLYEYKTKGMLEVGMPIREKEE